MTSALRFQEEDEEGEEQVDSGTMVKIGDGDDNTMIVNTTVQSQDTMIVNSEAGTLLESDLGTMVINSDEDEDATMKSKYSSTGDKNAQLILELLTVSKIKLEKNYESFIVKESTISENAHEEVSFEWTYFMILSTGLEVRTTLYSVVNSTTGKYCSVAFI